MRYDKLLFLVSMSLLVSSPRIAGASPLFELAGGTLGQGGFNARVTGAGAASTYFNPALLTESDQEFDVGFVVLSDQLSLTLDGRPGGDVPLAVGSRTALDPRTHAPIPNDTVPTKWLQNGCPQCGVQGVAARARQGAGSSVDTRTYTSIGLVSHILDPWLVLGLHALVPNGNFTQMNSFYNDEREQFFSNSLHPELYSDRLTATSLAFGVGSRPWKRFAVGVTFTLDLTNDAAASTYVRDPVDYQKLLLDNHVNVTTAVAPHVGVTYTPIDRLRLSATFHSVQKVVLHTGISATLPAGTDSHTVLTEVHDYMPWMLALGGDYDVMKPTGTQKLAFVWTVAYEAWSHYLDGHGESPGTYYGSEFAWKDVVTWSVGLRHAYGHFRTYVDGTYHPSPVPPQVGRSNYVDNDRIGVALGTDYEVRVFGHRMRFGIGAQADRLIARYQAKNDDLIRDEVPDGAVDKNLNPIPGTNGLQTNNPGWPGFGSAGWLLGGNAYASLIY